MLLYILRCVIYKSATIVTSQTLKNTKTWLCIPHNQDWKLPQMVLKVPETLSKTRLEGTERAHQLVLKSTVSFGLNKR